MSGNDTDDRPGAADARPEPDDSDATLPDSGATDQPPAAAYDVPSEADAASCGACGRPFPDDERLALHRGLEHRALDAADRDAAATARESERRRLRRFRLRALIALIVLYFGLLMTFAFVI